LEELKYKAPIDQLKAVSTALQGISNPTEKSALAMQIFGRSGGELLPVLTGMTEELANARGELGSLPGVMDRNAKSFDDISDKMTVMKGKLTEFAAGMLESAIPALNQFIGAGSKLDAAGFGAEIGKRLGEAFSMITSGDMWEVFKLQAQKAISGIQTSEAMTGFAAFLNSIGDLLFSDKAENFNFNAAFNKYMNAGVAANDELTAEIEKKMSAIWERQGKLAADAAKQFEKQMAESAAKSGIMVKDIKPREDRSREIPEWLKKSPSIAKQIESDSDKTARNFERIAPALEKSLTTSQQLAANIKAAQEKDKTDPGGRLEKRASEALSEGKLGTAMRATNRIYRREQEAEIKAAFGGKNEKAFGKSIQDQAREQGIDTFRKSSSELRKELVKKARERQSEMQPGKQGQTEEEAKRGGKAASDPMTIISKAVEEIRTLVKKIEPKLPTVALAN
jgi:hypothetical protein